MVEKNPFIQFGDQNSMIDSITFLATLYNISEIKPDHYEKLSGLFSEFRLFKAPNLTLLDSMYTILKKNKFIHLFFVQKTHIHDTGGIYPLGNVEEQLKIFPYIFLGFNSDFGNTAIRSETLQDKVMDFFLKTDIDFTDSPVFSRKYQCESDSEVLLRESLNPKMRNIIGQNDGWLMEFKNNLCVIGNNIRVEINAIQSLINFGFDLVNAE